MNKTKESKKTSKLLTYELIPFYGYEHEIIGKFVSTTKATTTKTINTQKIDLFIDFEPKYHQKEVRNLSSKNRI